MVDLELKTFSPTSSVVASLVAWEVDVGEHDREVKTLSIPSSNFVY